MKKLLSVALVAVLLVGGFSLFSPNKVEQRAIDIKPMSCPGGGGGGGGDFPSC